MARMNRLVLALAPAVVLLAAACARGDFASDRAECAEQLIALTPCLAFVENEARIPTPDCCASAKTVVVKSFKCLCMLIKDRNEPDLGFKINVTRAATMPGFCNVPANISDCSRLLKLQPGSPAAQEFDQLEKEIVGNIQAPTKSRNNINASNPSGTISISKKRFIMDLQVWFLFMAFIL